MNSRIIIDAEKCTVCGTCIEVCGAKTLEKIENKIVQTEPVLCNYCGHCVAICPAEAMTVAEDAERPFVVNKIEDDLSEIEKLLRNKRSVREFKNKEISKDSLEKLIYYAEKSPSSSNKRKREYYIVTETDKIKRIEKAVIKKYTNLKIIVNKFVIGIISVFSKKTAKSLTLLKEDIDKKSQLFENGGSPVFRDAPVVIFIAAPKGDIQALDDCVIAQQYMMLYGDSVGLGSTVIGYAQYAHKAVEKALNVKKGYSVFSVTIFGYSKYRYKKEIVYTEKVPVHWV